MVEEERVSVLDCGLEMTCWVRLRGGKSNGEESKQSRSIPEVSSASEVGVGMDVEAGGVHGG